MIAYSIILVVAIFAALWSGFFIGVYCPNKETKKDEYKPIKDSGLFGFTSKMDIDVEPEAKRKARKQVMEENESNWHE